MMLGDRGVRLFAGLKMWSVVLWTVLGLSRVAGAAVMGDQCDWSGRYVGGTFLFFPIRCNTY